MRALVIYESMFGNTETIAQAIAEGLATRMQVDVVEVGAAPGAIDEGHDLLVVGGPTHAFGMTRPSTRQDAQQKAGHSVISAQSGLREWLAGFGAVRTEGLRGQ
jgi:flavodoxin